MAKKKAKKKERKNLKSQILELLQKNKKALSGPEISKALGISPQTLSYHMKQLEKAGTVTRTGSTRAMTYDLSTNPSSKPNELTLVKKLKGLEEDRVFSELSLRMNLKKELNSKAYEIAQYTFTEMLNNAIDHSGAPSVTLKVSLEKGSFKFLVKDLGIGAFENVRKTFLLENEYAAMEHLFKGKQTTDPERHSGQGIFFTSRIADRFSLQSGKLKITIDNELKDEFLEEARSIKGTEVWVEINTKTRKNLKDVFDHFSNEDFEFSKNSVRVKLSRFEGLLSRSQAKRLLVGLEKFEHIEFDFKNVKSIGQAFADEIFRIYIRNHPDLIVSYTHANPAVAFMIERARKG